MIAVAIFMSAPFLSAPHASGGILDLKQWDFAKDGTVSLRGEWRFADSKWALQPIDVGAASLARVPGPWPATSRQGGNPRQNGYGTFVLRIELPATKGERFAIDTGYVFSAYRLYANGKVIAESGVPAATEGKEVARAYSRIVAVPDGVSSMELRLEISNHLSRYGGTLIAPTLGLESEIVGSRDLAAAMSLLLLGAMLFAACYHVAAFLILRSDFTIFGSGCSPR